MAVSTLRLRCRPPCFSLPSKSNFFNRQVGSLRQEVRYALLGDLAARLSLSSTDARGGGVRTVTMAFLLFILNLGFGVSPVASLATPLVQETVSSDRSPTLVDELSNLEEGKTNPKFEAWKKKTFALSVPLRIVALNGSFPPSWSKDFLLSQGKRARLLVRFIGTLDSIFSQLSIPSEKKTEVKLKSVAAADLVTVGDSWLSLAIRKGLIVPIEGAEEQDWFQKLAEKWKVYLRRNDNGEIDPEGRIWAAPYRWGTMVIAYKTTVFKKHNLAPIEDWTDLWRPELAGRISMVDCPREVAGAVLKRAGKSYNSKSVDEEDEKNLQSLTRQVRLFDRTHYLKAFGVGDVWVAVGWSSDVLPIAKRSSNVAVVVPKSGASFWADLWAVPSACGLQTRHLGGRARGPSPLIHQWIEFCMESARSLPFRREVIPGAIPAAVQGTQRYPDEEDCTPMLDTNLVAGAPPPDILSKCEFLEPLSDAQSSGLGRLINAVRIRKSG